MGTYLSKIFALSITATSSLLAATEVESFTFEVSKSDLVSSTGKKITSGAGVIQQDRANFFKFKKKDGTDDAGTAEFFKSAKNRALIPDMIKNSLKAGLITKEDVSQLLVKGKIAHVIVSKNSADKLVCTIAITEAS